MNRFALAFCILYVPLYWFDFFYRYQESAVELREMLPGTIIRHVLRHGAKGDGLTDDTAAIQRCLDDVLKGPGGYVYLEK